MYTRFERKVKEFPNKIAVRYIKENYKEMELTYLEVAELVDRLADFLNSHIKGTNARIGVYLNRSHYNLITMLAIWKNGFVYVPIDTSFPQEYVKMILEDSGIRNVIKDQNSSELHHLETVENFYDIDDVLFNNKNNAQTTHINRSNTDQLSLIMYTSGSTGRPKGVGHKQHQLINRFSWTWETYNFSESDIFIQRTNVNFMPSMWEFLGGLLIGCTTVVLDDSISKDIYKLLDYLIKESINVIVLVPSMLEKLLNIIELQDRKLNLKLCILCGELLKENTFQKAINLLKNTIFLNDYGSTEMNGVLYYDNFNNDQSRNEKPFFLPIKNIKAYILDDKGEKVDYEEEGTLYISGLALALGYMNLPEENKNKFFTKIMDGQEVRMYNTGDRAKFNKVDGIVICGRNDQQVKINGIRIELDSVEQKIEKNSNVDEVCVIAKELNNDSKTLVAFIVSKLSSKQEIVEGLKSSLPKYMLPRRYVFLERLPRLANGKVDRQKLRNENYQNFFYEDKTSISKNIIQKAAKILGIPPSTVDKRSNFSELGFDSLSIVDFLNYLKKTYNSELSVNDMFNNFTIEKLIDRLMNDKSSNIDSNKKELVSVENSISSGVAEVAIVGMSVKYPCVSGLEEFWEHINEGRQVINTKNPEEKYSSVLSEDVEKENIESFNISPREIKMMDPSQKIFLNQVNSAIENSGYTLKQLQDNKTGVFLGSRKSDYQVDLNKLSQSDKAFAYMGNDSSITAARVSYALNFTGPALVVDTACSSSLMAVHLAYKSILDGDCDIAIVGGINVMNTDYLNKESSALGILSQKDTIRPFDNQADGTVINEGSGVVILSRLEKAKLLEIEIYGTIVGTAINQDGKTNGITAPSGDSQKRLMGEALNNSGVNPDSIDYIECHGTGTKLGDPIELQSIYEVLGKRSSQINIGTVKSNIGHTVACSGISSLVKVILSMKNYTIPKVVGFENFNEHVVHLKGFFNINSINSKIWEKPSFTMVNSFGFSGTNVCVILKPYVSQNKPSSTIKNSEEQHYQFNLTDNSQYIRQHKINGKAVLSGAAQLSYIHDIFDKHLHKKIVFKKVNWLSELVIEKDTKIDLYMLPENKFEILSGKKVISRGEFLTETDLKEEKFNGQLERQQIGTKREFYDYIHKSGIEYGGDFQLINSVNKVDNSTYFTEIDVPVQELNSDYRKVYLLDAIFHSSMAVPFFKSLELNNAFVPFSFDNLKINNNFLSNKLYVYIYNIGLKSLTNRKILSVDLEIFSESGIVLGSIEKLFLVSKVQPSSSQLPLFKFCEVEQQLFDENSTLKSTCFYIGQNKKKANFAANSFDSINEAISNLEDGGIKLAGNKEVFIIYDAGTLDNQTIITSFTVDLVMEFYKIFTTLLKTKEKIESINFLFLYSYKDEAPYIPLKGFFESLEKEMGNLNSKFLGIDIESENRRNILKNELINFESLEKSIIYKKQQRRVIKLQEVAYNNERTIKAGNYLVAGGLGDIGKYICEELLNNIDTRVIVLGKSPKSSKTNILKRFDQKRIEYIQVDTTDFKTMKEIFHQIKNQYGKLDGVIQCVGTKNDSLFFNKEKSTVSDVFESKFKTTKILDYLTENEKLNFFTIFSSISSYFGKLGQSDYSFANGMVETFCEYRNKQVKMQKRSGATSAILWPYWNSGGMKMTEKMIKEDVDKGNYPIESNQGVNIFKRVATNGLGNIMVKNEPAYQNVKEGDDTKTMDNVNENLLSTYLKRIISRVTEIKEEKINESTHFDELGLNSFLIVEIIEKLETDFGSLPKTLLFEYNTFSELKEFLVKQTKNLEIDTSFLEQNNMETTEVKQYNTEKPKEVVASVETPSVVEKESNESSKDKISIVGIAGKYPGAENLDEFWSNLLSGKDSITLGRKSNNKQLKVAFKNKFGGFINNIDEFDPLFFNISPKEAKLMDPQERKFLEIAYHTIQDAGYTKEFLNGKRVGVYVGAMWGLYQLYGNQVDKTQPNSNFASIANRVSYFFNFKGPSLTFDSMCSSSISALKYAYNDLKNGEIDYAIVGGVNVMSHSSKYKHLVQGNFYSKEGKCRSFGEGGQGYVPGEGVGAIFIKRYEDSYGENSYGNILGVGVNHGGRTSGYTVPSPLSQSNLIVETLKKAKISPEQINYIEAHGTGTALGDPIEIEGINRSYSMWTSQKQFCPAGSVKSNIGHLESAAGIAALTKVILQMQHSKIVPSIHSKVLNKNIDFENSPVYIPQKVIEWDCERKVASISSFGAGGTNGYLIVEEGTNEVEENYSDQVLPFALITGKDRDSLIENCKALNNFISDNTNTTYSLNNFLIDISNFFSVESKFISKDARMEQYFPTVTEYISFVNLLKKKYEITVSRQDLELTVYGFFEKYFTHVNLSNLELNFKNVLYTLQAKRDHFAHRVVIFCENLKQLQEELFNVVNGNLSDNIVYGKGENTDTTEKKLRTNIGFKQFSKPWVSGANYNWDDFYHNTSLKAVSLPGYVFRRESYWIELKDKRMEVDPLKEKFFSYELDPNDDNYKDHVINNYPILSGASLIDLVSQSLYKMDIRKSVIEEVRFFKPIILDNVKKININFEFIDDKKIGFSIVLVEEDEVISKGTISSYESIEGFNNYKAPDQSILSSNFMPNSSELYRSFASKGIKYGSRFRLVKSIIQLEKVTVGEHEDPIKTSSKIKGSRLDSSFQILSEYFNDTITYVPYMIKNLCIEKDSIPSKFYTEAWQNDDGTFSLNILDHDLNSIIYIDQLMMKPLNKKNLTKDEAFFVEKRKVITTLAEDKEKSNSQIITPDSELVSKLELLFPSTTIGTSLNSFNLEQNLKIIKKVNNFDLNKLGEKEEVLKLFFDLKNLFEKVDEFDGQKEIYLLARGLAGQNYVSGLLGMLKSFLEEGTDIKFRIILQKDETFHKKYLSRIVNKLEYYECDTKNTFQLEYKEEFKEKLNVINLSPSDVILINGGAGHLGTETLKVLSKQAGCRMITLGRTEISEQKKEQLKKYNADYLICDTTKSVELDNTIKYIKANYGKITGVINCAGVIKDHFLKNKSTIEIREVIKSKIDTTVNLDILLKEEELKFFVIYSSVAAIVGNVGQTDYAYANGVLDDFINNRKELVGKGERAGKTLGINWPMWNGRGMSVPKTIQEKIQVNTGFDLLSETVGSNILYSLLISHEGQFIVCNGEKDKIISYLNRFNIDESEANKTKQIKTIDDETLKKKIFEVVNQVTKVPLDRIDEDEDLNSYGIDSIMLVEMETLLSKKLQVPAENVFVKSKTIKDAIRLLKNDYSIKMTANKKIKVPYQKNEQKKNEELGHKDLVIIGQDFNFPGASDNNELDYSLSNEETNIEAIPHTSYYGNFIKRVDYFDPLFFNISPQKATYITPEERLTLMSVWNALENAGYSKEDLKKMKKDGKKVAIFAVTMYQDYKNIASDKDKINIGSSTQWSIPNRISYFLDTIGPSLAINTACSSAITALELANNYVKNDECALAVITGCNLNLDLNKFMELDENKLLQKGRSSQSFSDEGEGYIPSEGVATLILASKEQAQKHNDRIYCEVLSAKTMFCGNTTAFKVPSVEQITRLIEDTITSSGKKINEISYVEASANGLKKGDSSEYKALMQLNQNTQGFGECAMGTIKSTFGHMEAVSGLAQIIKVILQMSNNVIYPSLGFVNKINKDISLENQSLKLARKIEPWDTNKLRKISLVNSAGAGGAIGAAVIKEGEHLDSNDSDIKDLDIEREHVFLLSAKSDQSLDRYLETLVTELDESVQCKDIAYTLFRREHFSYRIAIIADTIISLKQKIRDKEYIDLHTKVKKEVSSKIVNSAKSWVDKQIDANEINYVFNGKIIDLPNYCFESKSYWIGDSYKNDIHKKLLIKPSQLNKLNYEKNGLQNEQHNFSINTISSKLNNIISSIVGIEETEITKEMTLSELGIDSLDVTRLVEMIETEISIKLNISEFSNIKDIKDLLREIYRKEIESSEIQKNSDELLLEAIENGIYSVDEADQLREECISR